MLKKLFQNETDIAASNETDLRKIAYLICRGGWPKVLGTSEKIALRQSIDYYDAVVNSDISRVDGKTRNPERARLLMRSYSRNIGTQIKYEDLRKDILGNDIESFSIETLYDYVDAFKRENETLSAENESLKSSIRDARAKADAIVEANKRTELQQSLKDFYRIVLPQEDIEEIRRLREVLPYLRDKEPLNKVIYKVYYEKPLLTMIGRVLG